MFDPPMEIPGSSEYSEMEDVHNKVKDVPKEDLALACNVLLRRLWYGDNLQIPAIVRRFPWLMPWVTEIEQQNPYRRRNDAESIRETQGPPDAKRQE